MYYSRKSTRIPGYDYSNYNYYFITICSHNRECIFGLPNQLNQMGCIVRKHIEQLSSYYKNVTVDHYVVMPNHIHMIVVLGNSEKNPNLSLLISLFKTGITKEIHKDFPGAVIWQRSFHDHIIRDQRGYEKIWNYIENNPLKWEEDCFFRSEQKIRGFRED